VGVISAIVEKEWGERNVGFDSLKSTLNRNMDEKGIVARIVSRRGSSAGAPLQRPLRRGPSVWAPSLEYRRISYYVVILHSGVTLGLRDVFSLSL
jgi:hypothetical protein